MNKAIISISLLLLFLFAADMQLAFAEENGATESTKSYDPSDEYWSSNCQNIARDYGKPHGWRDASLGFWITTALTIIIAVLISLITIFRRGLPGLRFEFLFWAALLVAIGFLAKGNYYPDVRGLAYSAADALRPFAPMPTDWLFSGLWHELFSMFPPSEEIFWMVSRMFGLALLALTYASATLIARDRLSGWLAAVVVGLSPVFIEHFAASTSAMMVATLMAGAFAMALLAVIEGSLAGWILFPILTAFTAVASPVGALVCMIVVIGLISNLEGNRRRVLFTGLAIIGFAGGLLSHHLLGMELASSIASGWAWQGTWPPLVMALAMLAAVYDGLSNKRWLPSSMVAGCIFSLFVFPALPGNLHVSGAWNLPWFIFGAPLAIAGAVFIGKKFNAKPGLIALVWVLMIVLPGLIAGLGVKTDPNKAVYEFQREIMSSFESNHMVLYRVPNDSQPGAFFADFLGGKYKNICLRPREDIASDPMDHGERWIYFGTECANDRFDGKASKSECRLYRKLYRFDKSLTREIALPGEKGKPPKLMKISFSRIAEDSSTGNQL